MVYSNKPVKYYLSTIIIYQKINLINRIKIKETVYQNKSSKGK